MSAHDAQYAACAVTAAEVKPRPPWDKGRCAVAKLVAGMSGKPSKVCRHAATAVSWRSANSCVSCGAVVRRMWLQRGLAQNRSSSQEACKSSKAGMRSRRLWWLWVNSSVGGTVNTARYIVGRHITDSFQDPTLAFPALQGPQHRTTLVKGDNGKWQILELNEPLRLLVSLDAKFHDLQGNRSTITLVTPGEKDPYMMGFKFEDDGPMELQAEHHDDDGENVLFAPEDDVQVVGSTC